MSDIPRLEPKFTGCPSLEGEKTQRMVPGSDLSRHTIMIRDLGKCRFCGSAKLYEAPREGVVEELCEEVLRLHTVRTFESEDPDVVNWDVDEFLYRDMHEVAEAETGDPNFFLTINTTVEALRLLHQGLQRAMSKIEWELDALGEEV
jgi:hypothetical protein